MKLAIVTTCTASKAAQTHPPIALREVPATTDANARASAWRERLLASDAPLVRVQDLYQGDLWQQSLRAYGVARDQYEASFWVISAGYGLLPANEDTVIRSYDATFQTASEDAVARGIPAKDRATYHQQWWNSLARINTDSDGPPDRLSTLADQLGPDGGMLVMASQPYLETVLPELREVKAKLDPARLIIVSAGATKTLKRELSPHCLEFGSEWQSVLKGGAVSLNPRMAAWVLEQLPPGRFDCVIAQDLIRRMAPTPIARAVRRQVSDDEVIAFIREHLAQGKPSASKLLGLLRTELEASCEEKRFRALYHASHTGSH